MNRRWLFAPVLAPVLALLVAGCQPDQAAPAAGSDPAQPTDAAQPTDTAQPTDQATPDETESTRDPYDY